MNLDIVRTLQLVLRPLVCGAFGFRASAIVHLRACSNPFIFGLERFYNQTRKLFRLSSIGRSEDRIQVHHVERNDQVRRTQRRFLFRL